MYNQIQTKKPGLGSTHHYSECNIAKTIPDFSCSSSYVRRLHKQPTIESAPTPREGGQSRTESSLPRQHSIYSAGGYSSRDFTDQLFDHHQVRSNSPSYQGTPILFMIPTHLFVLFRYKNGKPVTHLVI